MSLRGRPRQNGSSRHARGLLGWQRDLRTYVVRRGIQIVCGTSAFPSETLVVPDIPLVRAAVRMMWLRALGAVGVKSLVTTSGLGHKFVCHIGDIAEYPFYHRHAYEKELELCAAWLRQEHEPVMYDVGANDGFFSSQIAQMMADRPIQIYAIEPVPLTFAKLVHSVRRLGLENCIQPIAAAVVDDLRLVRVGFYQGKSLLSQVLSQKINNRTGDEIAISAGINLDELWTFVRRSPNLVKIDVEGSEVAVLRGARNLLSGLSRPAMMIEYSPFALNECGESAGSLVELLEGYDIYYVNDHCGQKMPFGSLIAEIEKIQWTCNLFAVPAVEGSSGRWASALEQARHRLGSQAA